MKTKLLTTLLTLTLAFFANAADKHDHEHGGKAGPTGGKLITEVEPHVEFFVNKDKKVEIRFVDDDNSAGYHNHANAQCVLGCDRRSHHDHAWRLRLESIQI